MKIEKFIQEHKALCVLSAGTAILGYMGYKAVRWILKKIGLIAKTDQLARQTISDYGSRGLKKSKTPSRHYTSSSSESSDSESSDSEGPTIRSLPSIRSLFIPSLRIPIVGKKQSVASFIKSEFSGETSRSKKYINRLSNISKYFNKLSIYPTQGDGNCFCNAAIAGLIEIMHADAGRYRQMSTILLERGCSHSAPYIKDFSQEADFNLVIDRLSQQPALSLLNDDAFAVSFSRIIRHLIVCEIEDKHLPLREIVREDGDYIDTDAITVLNSIFDINAQAAVLSAPSNTGADLDRSDTAYIVSGRKAVPDGLPRAGFAEGESPFLVDLSKENRNRPPEFLIIRQGAHFIAMV
jgi:hypothetical protein